MRITFFVLILFSIVLVSCSKETDSEKATIEIVIEAANNVHRSALDKILECRNALALKSASSFNESDSYLDICATAMNTASKADTSHTAVIVSIKMDEEKNNIWLNNYSDKVQTYMELRKSFNNEGKKTLRDAIDVYLKPEELNKIIDILVLKQKSEIK